MSRTHIIQHWSDAAAYSGEIVGNRLSSSKSLYLSNGMANTAMFADEEQKPSKKVTKSAFASISLPDRHYERMCEHAQNLDNEFDQGLISQEDYIYAKKLIEDRKAKAWKRLCKARSWDIEEDKEIYEETIFNSKYSLKNSLQAESGVDSIFLSLRDDNYFKRLYLVVKYIRGIFK